MRAAFHRQLEICGLEWQRVARAVAQTREPRVFGRVWSDPRHGLPRRTSR